MAIDIVGRVRKLLELSKNNPSQEEAAAAAAHAQELMFKFSIGEADLCVDKSDTTEAEEVVDETVHTDKKAKRDVWKSALAGTLARAFGCKCYTFKTLTFATKDVGFRIVGIKSVVQTVGYLFGYLVLEINQLADEAYRTHGGDTNARTWKNSFRLGAVGVIANRLAEQTAAQVETLKARRAAAPQSTALALYKSNQERVEDSYSKIAKEKGLRNVAMSHRVSSPNAYQRGRDAGQGLSLGGGKGLPASKTRIEA